MLVKKLLTVSLLTAGLTLASGAMAADNAASCAGCHGTDGVSTYPNTPTISGMSVDYFTATLQAFKKKTRPATEVAITAGDKKGTKSDMVKAIADLSDADFTALAQSFAAKKFVRGKQTADAALVAKGKDVHDKLCDKCHTEGGSVAEDDAGILAGQSMTYLKVQLADFKSGKRPSPTKMQPKIDLMQASDIDALVAYYGSAK